jgi:predicted Zn-dependent peptidase
MLPFACDYLEYLGTSDMTPEQVKKEFYRLACDYYVLCDGERTTVRLTGLAENMEEAAALMEKLIADAQANPQALMMLKLNTLQERENAKHDQRANSARLQNYGLYGAENPSKNILSQAELLALTDEQLLEKIHSIFNGEHKVTYYGPLTGSELVAAVNKFHNCPEKLEPVVEGDPFKYLITEENTILFAPYDANQAIIYSLSSNGEPFDATAVPISSLYNEYFGGGMNGIVFQEMREARGLAYGAGARYMTPSDLDHSVIFLNYIQTQNDKVIDALTAFEEIINNMPESETAFGIAKESMISNMRTARTVKAAVLNSYLNAEKLGLDYDINKDVYEKASGYTLKDVVDFQKANVKDRKYTICILGRESDIDFKALEKFGKIKKVTTDEIFGY